MQENGGLLKKIIGAFSRQQELAGLLAMAADPNGFEREKAVRRLGTLGNAAAVPALLTRVNDWVPQVRAAARESLKRLMTAENAKAFVDSLPALYHLRDCGRSDHRQVIEEVTRFLLLPENVPELAAGIDSEDPYVARICVRLCIGYDLIEKGPLVVACLRHGDVVVRNTGAGLLNGLSGDELDNALTEAVRDPFMPIRREAFNIALERRPEWALELAHGLLFDKHPVMREIAIAQLLGKGTDVRLIYAEVLSSPSPSVRTLRCALLGLAHLGANESILSVEHFLCDGRPGVRRAALQALARIVGEHAGVYLMRAMNDESPAVVKEAAALLKSSAYRPSVGELMRVVNGSKYFHSVIACVRSARYINKWERLIFLLMLCERSLQADRSTAELANEELAKWDREFNRSSSQPTVAQKKRVWDLYRRCAPFLGEKRRMSMDFTLGHFGRAARGGASA